MSSGTSNRRGRAEKNGAAATDCARPTGSGHPSYFVGSSFRVFVRL
jgi:hypothetical protein